MKTTADEILTWKNCRETIVTGTTRYIEENIGNDYMFNGDIDNDILDGVESVINELNDKHDLRLDLETIYQKSWELASEVICDDTFIYNFFEK